MKNAAQRRDLGKQHSEVPTDRTVTTARGRRLNVVVQDTGVRGELRRLLGATVCGGRPSLLEGTEEEDVNDVLLLFVGFFCY